jgi:rhamnogalacturonan endolyase
MKKTVAVALSLTVMPISFVLSALEPVYSASSEMWGDLSTNSTIDVFDAIVHKRDYVFQNRPEVPMGAQMELKAFVLGISETIDPSYFYYFNPPIVPPDIPDVSDNDDFPMQGEKRLENLDFGLTAIPATGGNFVSWRNGAGEENAVYELYRGDTLIYTSAKGMATSFLDKSGNNSSSYTVKSQGKTSKVVKAWANSYLDITLKPCAGGTALDGEKYTYEPTDCSAGDLDGDGEYEIIVQWTPTNAHDNAHEGYTGNVYYDAYKLDSTHLWRIDMGKNIRAGQHYNQFIVMDFDGDGLAEMAVKTADGTIDGTGKVIGDGSKDYRTSAGRILSGPEFLTLFDGKTGKELDTIDYEPGRGNVNSWGDNYGNRCDRFLAGAAYLDGKNPSLVMCRGYYTRSVLVAYDVVDGKFKKRWTFDSNTSGNFKYAGQGAHSLSVADVDGDGFDEIIYGSCTIDHDGKGLYTSELGHGDALHVSKFLQDREGLQIWMVHESSPYGGSLRDAATGELIFRSTAGSDTGRGIAGNFISNMKDGVFMHSGNNIIYNEKGDNLGNFRVNMAGNSSNPPSMNFAVWWDGDIAREILDRTMVEKYGANGGSRLLRASGVSSNTGKKATPGLVADLFGDWREEIIFRTSDNTKLRIFSSTMTTDLRLTTLMHDAQYRCAIAWQNVAYNQPPHPRNIYDLVNE